MAKWCFVLTTVAMLVLANPESALAKGVLEATIEGPGLAAPIRVEGSDASGLADQAGFWKDGAWGTWPDPMLAEAPTSDLGPRYLVKWVVAPGGATIIQELYPHAQGGPLSHLPPGQSLGIAREHGIYVQGEVVVVERTIKTRGGWYRAPQALRATLFDLGVPAQAPPPGPSRLPWALVALAVLAAVASLLLHQGRTGRGRVRLLRGTSATTHQGG